MKLINAEILNYKSIGMKAGLPIETKSTVIVGPSNVGKSNILESIESVFNSKPLSKRDICTWADPLSPSDPYIRLKFLVEGKDQQPLLNFSNNLENKSHLTITKKRNGETICVFCLTMMVEKCPLQIIWQKS